MFSSILSAAISGVNCVPVRVEADVSNGLPLFSMVDICPQESKRLRTGSVQHLKQRLFSACQTCYRQSFPCGYPERGNRF